MSDSTHRLSSSAEDYLEAIGHLCHKNGCAQVSDIAEMLGVKKPSVTAAMRRLAELGMIEYRQYSPIQLTEKGARYAESVISAHRILYRFMEEMAGLSSERAGEAACLLEHLLSQEEIDGIAARLKANSAES
ncbi:MAG: metal-dependent transcriptional regulator [Akkermansia sp.]|nr:metal-dependent transcriptional regulator [Akkermansia sp.]